MVSGVRNTYSWWLYKAFIIILMLTSFRAWMFWSWADSLFFWIGAFLVSVLFLGVNDKFYSNIERKRNIVWFVLLQILLILGKGNNNLNGLLATMIPTWSVFSLITLNKKYKQDIFETLYKVLCIILFVSLIAWILFLVGFSFSYEMVPYGVDDLYYYENYHLFLRNTTMGGDFVFPRFCSIFLEPGYLGCLVSLILYIRHYKLDFWGVVLILVLFMTFSLAGWVISLVGFTSIKCIESKRPVLLLTLAFSSLLFIWGSAKMINGGDNLFNNMIFERLQYDDHTGTFAGYNRLTEDTNDWFWSSFVKSPDVLFGSSSPSYNLKINDIDWKAYIVRNGLVGLFMFVLFAYYPYFSLRKRFRAFSKYIFILSTLYLLIFSQTISLILSTMYISMIIFGDAVIRFNEFQDHPNHTHNKLVSK